MNVEQSSGEGTEALRNKTRANMKKVAEIGDLGPRSTKRSLGGVEPRPQAMCAKKAPFW
jgi:hypothetical protein